MRNNRVCLFVALVLACGFWSTSSVVWAQAASRPACTTDGPPPGFEPTATPAAHRFDLAYSTSTPTRIDVRLVSHTTGGVLVIVGTHHVTSPDPALFDQLEQLFIREQPSAAYVEVDDVAYLSSLPADMDEVIRTRGEPSYLGFIARQRGVVVLPLEPAAASLFGQVRQNFPPELIALAHILRDVQLARDRRRLFGEALESAASRSIAMQREIVQNANLSASIRNILDLTLTVGRHWPGLDWRQVPAEWFNPLLQSSATGSGFINAIFAQEKAIRDRHALRLLLSRVANGERVVALVGRTHADSALQTLNCLMTHY